MFIFLASLLLFEIYGLFVAYNILVEYLYDIPRFLYGSTSEYNFIVAIFGEFNFLYYKMWLFLNIIFGNIVGFVVVQLINKKKIILPWIRGEEQLDTTYAQVVLSNLLINFVGAIILLLLGLKLVGPVYLIVFFSCGYLSAIDIYFIKQLRQHPEILSYRVKW